MCENYRGERLWIEICKRANGQCEYCGIDLFGSPENYLLAQRDHIIPRTLRARGKNTFNNSALSCYICNVMLKGKWNPRNSELVGENPERKDLIEAVRKYVEEKRIEKGSYYERLRRIIEEEGSQ